MTIRSTAFSSFELVTPAGATLRIPPDFDGNGLELLAARAVRHKVDAVVPPWLGHLPARGEDLALEGGPPFSSVIWVSADIRSPSTIPRRLREGPK